MEYGPEVAQNSWEIYRRIEQVISKSNINNLYPSLHKKDTK